jgi:hypothetical protein
MRNRLVWRLRSHLLTCAYGDCTRRAAAHRRAIVAHGHVWAPYVIFRGGRYPLCRKHATSDKDRCDLILQLLGS